MGDGSVYVGVDVSKSHKLFPAIGTTDVAWSENRSFTVSELVEAEQRVIANAFEVSIIRCFFLLAMHGTLRTVDIQNHPLVDSVGHSTFYPLDIQPLKALQVILLGEQFCFEPAHFTSAGSFLLRAFPAHHYSHGSILG